MHRSTLSLNSALDGGGWLRSRPGRCTSEKRSGTSFIRGWVGPRAGQDGRKKSRPNRDLIFFSPCTLSVLPCPDLPGYCLLSLLYNTHNTNINALGGIRTRNPSRQASADPHLRPPGHWDRPEFCLLFLLTTHKTNILHPDKIRIRYPSKQLATGIVEIRSPDFPARNKSLYRLSYRSPQ